MAVCVESEALFSSSIRDICSSPGQLPGSGGKFARIHGFHVYSWDTITFAAVLVAAVFSRKFFPAKRIGPPFQYAVINPGMSQIRRLLSRRQAFFAIDSTSDYGWQMVIAWRLPPKATTHYRHWCVDPFEDNKTAALNDSKPS